MNRKLVSLAGVLVAVFSFAVGSTDVEARHCRSHRNRCCQQQRHTGYQQNSNNYGNRNDSYQQAGNHDHGQATYSTTAEAAIDAGQPAVQPAAPVPNN